MRKTAEPRENKIGPRADCQNKSDVSHHSNARPDSAKMSIVGHGLARSLTSLTRFGTSFWALILAACGGGGGGGGGGPTISGSSTAGPSTGGPSTGGIMASNIGSPAAPKMVDLSGFAYNRPLAGGEVWLDVNDNQQIDAAELAAGKAHDPSNPARKRSAKRSGQNTLSIFDADHKTAKKSGKNGGGEGKVFLSDLIVN